MKQLLPNTHSQKVRQVGVVSTYPSDKSPTPIIKTGTAKISKYRLSETKKVRIIIVSPIMYFLSFNSVWFFRLVAVFLKRATTFDGWAMAGKSKFTKLSTKIRYSLS